MDHGCGAPKNLIPISYWLSLWAIVSWILNTNQIAHSKIPKRYSHIFNYGCMDNTKLSSFEDESGAKAASLPFMENEIYCPRWCKLFRYYDIQGLNDSCPSLQASNIFATR